jgi:signal transduction histidine kinase
MKRKTILITFFIKMTTIVTAQQTSLDRMKAEVNSTTNDTVRLSINNAIAEEYTEINPDSSLLYAEKVLRIAQQLKLKLEEVHALGKIGYSLVNKGNYPRSLQSLLSAITIAEDPASEKNILPVKFPPSDEFTDRHASAKVQRIERLSRIHQYLGILYGNANDYEKSKYHYLQAKHLADQTNNLSLLSITNNTLGRLYLTAKKYDSAFLLATQAYEEAIKAGYKKYLGSTLLNLGRIYAAKGDVNKAVDYYEQAIIASSENNYYLRGIAASNLALADLYKQIGKEDSVFRHIQNALFVAQSMDAPDLLLRCYTAFSNFYNTAGNSDSIVKYQSLIIRINDSLFSVKQAQQFQNIDFDEQQRQQQIETANAAYRNKIRLYLLLGGLAIFLLIAILLWRNSRHRKLANRLLTRQKQQLESALERLKTTQGQLIQSEKMASLGELTAGIAHEIQNPLNFVNNFSEVNTELIDELFEEIEKGNLEQVKAIAKDIVENEKKINSHGKRADAIVKGMLQHSRSSSGQKEMTDINALCDEYLRLAYHGMRVKDKSFNAKFETDFDNSIGKINIVPQDMGRVILNLINNAFYVVNEKAKRNIAGYEPSVTVSTKKENGKIIISVADNGNGIPVAIKEKIFQPFFTTKPTGSGTGLGLSLSYDIIKAHGGEIKVETEEGKGSTFIIKLSVV